ncbi:MAG: hypothetical protein V1934_01790 [Methanobacteriota archaeon]
MGLFDFLKSKPSTEHRDARPGRDRARRAIKTGRTHELWEIPRRRSLLSFVDENRWHLVRNKFTYKSAAKKAETSKAEIYHLIQSKYYLFAMSKKLRAYCGEPVRGSITGAPQCDAVVAASLKRLACPTAIMGLLARVIEKDGMEKARGILRFLERAYADPERYAGKLLTLADRYDMVPPPPAA